MSILSKFDIFEMGQDVFDIYGRRTGERKYPDELLLAPPSEIPPGHNLAGYPIPLGDEAEFIAEELGIDPKFFCFSFKGYYVLITSSERGLVRVRRYYWEPDQLQEWSRICQGGWVQLDDEDEDAECTHEITHMSTCAACGKSLYEDGGEYVEW